MDIFDANFYTSFYPDLRTMNPEQAKSHWLAYGWRERRRINQQHCLESYLCRYLDLRQAAWIKGSHLGAYQHYLQYGHREGRITSSLAGANVIRLLWSERGYGKISWQNTLARVGVTTSSTNMRPVRVGIIDTGVTGNYLKFDLSDPPNGIDDDRNGIIDDNIGYDTLDKDIDPSDPYGHGTAVANVIHNLSPHSSICAIKVGGTNGNGTTQSLADGIIYAVNKKLDIVNISMGATHPTAEVEAAIAYAQKNKLLIVASAGNNGGYPLNYPAMYTEKYNNVIAVGATEENGENLYKGSDWQTCHCDPSTPKGWFVTAKGKNVTQANSWMNQGTSFSAPQVTALIANLMAKSFLPSPMEAICDYVTMSSSSITP